MYEVKWASNIYISKGTVHMKMNETRHILFASLNCVLYL